jgi:streptomycin 6-kinase
VAGRTARRVDALASGWELELGDPYLPGGQCAWVAPARRAGDVVLVFKVGWQHREAEHEAEALRFWNGNGAVRCLATRTLEDSTALLLERCTSGHQLRSVPELEQDEIIAGLLRRLWARLPQDGHPFASLDEMCGLWADWFELDYAGDSRGVDPGSRARASRCCGSFPPAPTRGRCCAPTCTPETSSRPSASRGW